MVLVDVYGSVRLHMGGHFPPVLTVAAHLESLHQLLKLRGHLDQLDRRFLRIPRAPRCALAGGKSLEVLAHLLRSIRHLRR